MAAIVMKMDWLKNKDGIELWKLPEVQRAAMVALVPLLYFAFVIRVRFTYGDGPELLLAATRFGVPHPSGYPLYTLLASIPAHIPWPSPYWNVAFLLSALPTALTVAGIYLLLRRLDVDPYISALAGWMWGFNNEVAYLATRVEVYALHCMFVVGALYALLRYAKGDGHHWAYASVAGVCLGLTNHLTSSFLIVPATLGIIAVDRAWFFQKSTILRMCGIAAAGASVYIYFPIAAMLNDGDTVTWNDPQTLERFWFHVSGQEYSIFRNAAKFETSLMKFASSVDSTFFPGAQVIVFLGLWEAWLRDRVTTFAFVIFSGSLIVYVSTYTINDISTYFTGIYLITAILIGLAADWFLSARFPDDEKWASGIRLLAYAGAAAFIGHLGVVAWGNHYREATAQDMAEQVYSELKQPAIIFTSVDGHSFPLWYERYANHPDDEVIPIDQVMFRLDNKEWYRDFHRDNFDWVKWPTKEQFRQNGWEQWLIDNNPDINFYAMVHNVWRSPKSYTVNKGWHSEIRRGRNGPEATTKLRQIYLARIERYRKSVYTYDALREFKSGVDKIACVTEWATHPDISGDWKFYGPNGKVVSFPPHAIPSNSNMSWEYLEVKDQVPGKWRCEVTGIAGEPPISLEFELK
jgi:hypothetical protein